MKIYIVIEVNELDLYDGACVNVYPCFTEESAKNKLANLLTEAKNSWFTEYKSENWSETFEPTSYCGGDSDGRRLQFYITESELSNNHKNMEERFIVIINFDPTQGEILKIKLTDEQLDELEQYEDVEAYLSTLEEEYGFTLSNSVWMATSELSERKIGF